MTKKQKQVLYKILTFQKPQIILNQLSISAKGGQDDDFKDLYGGSIKEATEALKKMILSIETN